MKSDTTAFLTLVEAALAEDIGRGDITSEAVIPADAEMKGFIHAREPLVACGVAHAAQVFYQVDPGISCISHAVDGISVAAGGPLLEIAGNARSILLAERTALNLLARMCGIATLTRRYVEAVGGTQARICDTRKTPAMHRATDKHAVVTGGGCNHRMRLDDGILIKDNHIAIAGGVSEAVKRARDSASHLMRVSVECDTLEQVKEALEAGADVLLLDNMTPDMLSEAVKFASGRALTEASGGVTLENVRTIAETGVHYISVGALTHSVRAADIGLDAYVE